MEKARITLRVQPGARRAGVTVNEVGSVTVRVNAAPEKGKANDAVLSLLARSLGIPLSALEIAQGHTSRQKTVLVEGLSDEEVIRRLQASADSAL